MQNSFLVLFSLSVSTYAELSKNANDVVTDSITKLQWQDNVNPYDTQKELSLVNATVYCEDLVLDGHNDWRLPNINELSSLIDDTKYFPAMNAIFQNQQNNVNDNLSYWSSTTMARTPTKNWNIQFHEGTEQYYNGFKATAHFYVRCVRSL